MQRQNNPQQGQMSGDETYQSRRGPQRGRPPAQDPMEKLPKKTTTCMVLAIITLIIALIAGGSTWWETDSYFSGTTEFGLDEVEYEGGSESLDGNMEDVADLTSTLETLAAVMAFIVMFLTIGAIGLVVNGYPRYLNLLSNLIPLAVILCLIFAVIAPIYYAIEWPNAVEDDTGGEWEDKSFMGTNGGTWGPGGGWYLAITTIILAIITLISSIQGRRELKHLARTMPPKRQQYPPRQGGQQQYQQGGQQQSPPQQGGQQQSQSNPPKPPSPPDRDQEK